MKNLSLFRLLAPCLPGLLWLGTTHSARGQCFQPAQNYRLGSKPVSATVSDFNRDGKPDLFVANQAENNVALMVNNGNGTFQTYDFFSMYNPVSVAVGDFDGDGNPDLATLNQHLGPYSSDPEVLYIEYVLVWLGNGRGSFKEPGKPVYQEIRVGRRPTSVAAGDFNGDGKDDLAVANSNYNTVSVLLSTGDGSIDSEGMTKIFDEANYFIASDYPVSVAVGDFNGDGRADLATANAGNNVSVLLGNGDGTFQGTKNFGAGNGPVSVAVGDFNADARADLAVANSKDNTVSVRLSTGDANLFGEAKTFRVGGDPQSVAVGDFNQDGKPDLTTANRNDNTASVLLGTGSALGLFGQANHFGVGDAPMSVVVGDFNVDGEDDLATANFNSGDVSVLLNASLNFGVSLGGGPTCVGQPLSLTLTPGCTAGPYTVQLSSAHGSFANPRNLGTLQPGANALPLPAGLPGGTGYRVRILYGGWQMTAPSAPFAVSVPAYSVAGYSPSVGGVPVCRGGQVTVSFSVPSGSCPLPEGRTTAQLSSAQGSFNNPTSLGLVEPNVANAVTIPASVAAGTGYRVRLVHAGQASAYSRVFQVKACAGRLSAEEAQLVVVPNPAAGGAIRCRVAGMDDPSFSLTTSAGRGVGISVQPDGSGEWVLRPKQRLTPGAYVVQATEGTTRLTQRVLVAE